MHNVLALEELKTIFVIINLMDVKPCFLDFYPDEKVQFRVVMSNLTHLQNCCKCPLVCAKSTAVPMNYCE